MRDPVCVRIGTPGPGGDLYIDLSDATGRAVKISADGWEIIDEPPLLFPTGQNRRMPLFAQKGGSIHALREMFGLSANDEALIISFCLSCLKGTGPYPPLLIVGPDGSGKTALASYLRMLLDPATPVLRNIPKNEQELAIAAKDNHVLGYDDVDGVPAWLGSATCKLAKGTTFSGAHRGCEIIRFDGARPVIMAGDEGMLLNRELASRALVVRLEPRTTFTSKITEDFRGLARMRGALFDIVSHGLGRFYDLELSEPVRDYEFEKWIAACELSRWGLGAFSQVYETNVLEGRTDAVELDPFLAAFQTYMAKVGTFRGTAGQLLLELNAVKGTVKGNRWPNNARAISGRLRRDAKLLPGIKMEFGLKEGHNRDRIIVALSVASSGQVEHAMTKEVPEERGESRRKSRPKPQVEKEPGLFAGF